MRMHVSLSNIYQHQKEAEDFVVNNVISIQPMPQGSITLDTIIYTEEGKDDCRIVEYISTVAFVGIFMVEPNMDPRPKVPFVVQMYGVIDRYGEIRWVQSGGGTRIINYAEYLKHCGYLDTKPLSLVDYWVSMGEDQAVFTNVPIPGIEDAQDRLYAVPA